jgi:pimeloyl-ACP methyl ester carboxylesterase
MCTRCLHLFGLLTVVTLACVGATAQHPEPTKGRSGLKASFAWARAVDEEGFVEIGGIQQWVAIRGADRNAPVLVIVHGGPGAAWSGFVVPQFAAWEKRFPLVLWDQRGAGRTFGRSGPVGTDITIQRMALDGIEVAQYVCKRLHRSRLILMGVSWGSVVAIHMVKTRPDLFHGYVGAGQVVNWHANEALAYKQVLAKARKAADQEGITALEKIGPPPYDNLRSLGIRSNWAAQFEPGAPTSAELLKMPFSAPGYSKADAQNWLEGLDTSQEHFFGATMDGPFTKEDLGALGTKFEVPIFFFQGTEDDVAPATLVKSYSKSLQSPHVEYVPIEGAGHYAFMTQSELFLKLLVKLVRPLAR